MQSRRRSAAAGRAIGVTGAKRRRPRRDSLNAVLVFVYNCLSSQRGDVQGTYALAGSEILRDYVAPDTFDPAKELAARSFGLKLALASPAAAAGRIVALRAASVKERTAWITMTERARSSAGAAGAVAGTAASPAAAALPSPSSSSSAASSTRWQHDELCYGCRKEFTLTHRRHHCRRCGHAFCQPCSSKTARIPRSGGTGAGNNADADAASAAAAGGAASSASPQAAAASSSDSGSGSGSKGVRVCNDCYAIMTAPPPRVKSAEEKQEEAENKARIQRLQQMESERLALLGAVAVGGAAVAGGALAASGPRKTSPAQRNKSEPTASSSSSGSGAGLGVPKAKQASPAPVVAHKVRATRPRPPSPSRSGAGTSHQMQMQPSSSSSSYFRSHSHAHSSGHGHGAGVDDSYVAFNEGREFDDVRHSPNSSDDDSDDDDDGGRKKKGFCSCF